MWILALSGWTPLCGSSLLVSMLAGTICPQQGVKRLIFWAATDSMFFIFADILYRLLSSIRLMWKSMPPSRWILSGLVNLSTLLVTLVYRYSADWMSTLATQKDCLNLQFVATQCRLARTCCSMNHGPSTVWRVAWPEIQCVQNLNQSLGCTCLRGNS